MGDDLDTFGKRLRSARKAAKLSQEQLAQMAGIAQPTVSELEGDRYDGSSFAPELAAACHVEALWLKVGKGPRRQIGGAVDTTVLRDVLLGVDRATEGRRLTADRRAQIASAVYQMLLESEAKPNPDTILRLLRGLL